MIERETLKLGVQHPDLVSRWSGDLDEDDFTHPAYRALWRLLAERGLPAEPDPTWVAGLRGTDPRLDDLVTALAVEQLKSPKQPGLSYVRQHVSRLQELTALRRITDLKSKLQRTNPVEHAAEYNRMFGELVALEQHRRQLRELAVASE
jgi:DNA primase